MPTIESYEVETFRRFHLDCEAVHRYRLRLACVPPLPLKDLRTQKLRMQKLHSKIMAVKRQMDEAINQLGEKAVFYHPLEVCSTPDASCVPGQMDWDLESHCWGKGYRYRDYEMRKVYNEKPDKEDALRAWNLFLVAFRVIPTRLLKVRGENCHRAEYRDTNGNPVTIAETDIRLKSLARHHPPRRGLPQNEQRPSVVLRPPHEGQPTSLR